MFFEISHVDAEGKEIPDISEVVVPLEMGMVVFNAVMNDLDRKRGVKVERKSESRVG